MRQVTERLDLPSYLRQTPSLLWHFKQTLYVYISSYSKAVNATHVVKWENGKVVKSEMS